MHGGLFNLEAGDGGLEYAGGALSARFHYFKPTELLISTSQQGNFFSFKRTQEATEATMFLRTEPALPDRFIVALPKVDRQPGKTVVLECVRLGEA